VQTFVVAYASALINGAPCPDARGRLRKAMKIARETDGTIVIGVGSFPGKQTFEFSEASARYLNEQGWPSERILVNPAGWNTINESIAAYEAIKKAGGGKIVVVSTWYHILRVWLIWAIVLKKFVRVGINWRTYPWWNPPRELLAFPFTLFRIAKLKLARH